MTGAGWRIAGRWALEVVILAAVWALYSHFIARDPWRPAVVGGLLFAVCAVTVLLLVEAGYAYAKRRASR